MDTIRSDLQLLCILTMHITHHLGLVYCLLEIVLRNECWEMLMSKVFNILQSEEQFPPGEGESSQENLPYQEADRDQVDMSVVERETNITLVRV